MCAVRDGPHLPEPGSWRRENGYDGTVGYMRALGCVRVCVCVLGWE